MVALIYVIELGLLLAFLAPEALFLALSLERENHSPS
jgi:hypothetical protein